MEKSMRYHMSQAELKEAIQYYLNEEILREPVTVKNVEPKDKKALGINYVLHVVVSDDQRHIDEQLRAVGT
jgi:hypothetical protein